MSIKWPDINDIKNQNYFLNHFSDYNNVSIGFLEQFVNEYVNNTKKYSNDFRIELRKVIDKNLNRFKSITGNFYKKRCDDIIDKLNNVEF
jgi:hypothetical protein